MEARMSNVEARLAALESKSGISAPAAGGGAAEVTAPFVRAYDDLLAEFFNPVEKGAAVCGADVEKAMAVFKEALAAQRTMLVIASKCKKPGQADLEKVIKPTSELLMKLESMKDRRSKQFNHLAMVAEGGACLGWVCVEPTPVSFLSDTMPGSEMYGNKVVMEFKNTDNAAQADFAKGFKAFLLELQKYVKAHHTTGTAWNPAGGTQYSAASGPPPPPPAPKGGPPGPPPPPPPAGFFKEAAAAAAPAGGGGGGAAALFAELNALGAAGAATASLKKVQREQMTHKNPALRASSVVPDKTRPAPAGAPAGARAPAAKKPPSTTQNGNKWFIENHVDNRALEVTDTSAKTAVCMVGCTRSLLQVPGKINTLQIDGCVKTSVVVGSCVASVDIINCKSCEIQITEWTPMITLDGCAGAIVYLSQKCVDDDVAIVTSKCSELNIVLPARSESEDPVELPVPEQFETRVRNGALVTTSISHVGA